MNVEPEIVLVVASPKKRKYPFNPGISDPKRFFTNYYLESKESLRVEELARIDPKAGEYGGNTSWARQGEIVDECGVGQGHESKDNVDYACHWLIFFKSAVGHESAPRRLS